MTRARIIELLGILVLEMGNKVPPPNGDPHPAVSEAEWAYIKGLAAGAVLRFQEALITAAGK